MIDVYAWLLSKLGGYQAFRETPLVLPTPEFFPVVGRASGHDLAASLFDRVCEHVAIPSRWRVRVEPLEKEPSSVDLMGEDVAFGAGAPRRGPVSQLLIDDDAVVVRYAPYLLERPEAFIAAMAYELAHLLVLGPAQESEPPGVDTLEGPFLEVAATFLGYGVFVANAVYNMESVQDLRTQGWNVHTLGVLSELEVSYALALFLALKGEGMNEAKLHLKPNPRSYSAAALNVLARDGRDSIAALRSVAPSPS
jgi:hypothetical protein